MQPPERYMSANRMSYGIGHATFDRFGPGGVILRWVGVKTVRNRKAIIFAFKFKNAIHKELRTKIRTQIGLLAYFTVNIRYTIYTVLDVPFP